jgi:Tol biopolymer transport system component
MRKLIFWSMAVCLAFALAPSAPALADDDGVINHGLLGVHPDIQGDVDGILQVTTVHEDDEWGEGGSSSNWVPSWGANPWSSDGEKIVYQSTRIDPISGWQQYEICTMNADGTGWQQLTNNSRCDSHASFVPPNNEKIVFQRNVNQDEGEWGPWDGNGEIWIMDADGSNQVSLTQQHGGPVEEGSCENHPVVSPDGQFIAFRTCGGELWVMGINGELLYPFPVSGELRTHHHIWHPFLPMIVFSGSEGWGDSRIYGVFLGEGGFEPPQEGGDGDIQPLGVEPGEPLPPEIFRISPEEDEIPFESWCENWPSISPDGERLAYHSRYSGLLLQGEGDMEEFPFGDIHAIWVWGDEEAPQPVAIHFEGDGTPWSKIQGPTSWAPDSITLAYVAEQGDGEGDFEPLAVEPVDDGDEGEDEEPPYPQQALFIVDTDSLEKTQLTEGYQDTRPWWSPDGGKILFKENNDWWGGGGNQLLP